MLCCILPASAVDKKTVAELDRQIEKIRPEMAKLRRFLHMNPQLANRETETAKSISANLAKLGLDVQTGVAKTGVVGLLRGAQPGATVAVIQSRPGWSAVGAVNCARTVTTLLALAWAGPNSEPPDELGSSGGGWATASDATPARMADASATTVEQRKECSMGDASIGQCNTAFYAIHRVAAIHTSSRV